MRRWTVILMIVATCGLVAWDVLAAANRTQGDTISEIIRDWSSEHPILAFAAGLLCGHWFWSR